MRLNWKPYPLVYTCAGCFRWYLYQRTASAAPSRPPSSSWGVRNLCDSTGAIYARPREGSSDLWDALGTPSPPRRESIKTYFRCPDSGKSVLKLHESLKRVGGFTSTFPQEFWWYVIFFRCFAWAGWLRDLRIQKGRVYIFALKLLTFHIYREIFFRILCVYNYFWMQGTLN